MIPTSSILRGSCLLACLMFTAEAGAQGRAFMDAAGNNGAGQPQTGSTFLNLTPASSQIIETFLVDKDPGGTLVTGYQLIFQCTAVGGSSGSIDYIDNNPGNGGGDSIFINTLRADWLFANSIAPNPNIIYNETCTMANINGVIYNTAIPLDDRDPNLTFDDSPAYMAEFEIAISSDACGLHTLQWNTADTGVPPLAAIFAPGGAEWFPDDAETSVEFQNLDIFIGPLNDDCVDAIDLGSAGQVQVPFDTTCATVDGPQDCATGADIWFLYSHPLDNELMIDVTNGDVVVYPATSCPPAGGGICGGMGLEEEGEYLIQIIGDDIQGILEIQSVCCLPSSCHDMNPCTDDICICACSFPPNSNPCDDGDPCTVNDTCADGACQPGQPVDGNDFNPCTNDFCVPGSGVENEDINGAPCVTNDDCNIGTVEGAICEEGSCLCTAGMVNSLCLELRDPKSDETIQPCAVDGADDQCAEGDHCIDGFCLQQGCYAPGEDVIVDLELFPTIEDVICGGQFFLSYDTACLNLIDVTTDPDDELGWDMVVVNDTGDGTIDLALAIPPALQCCVDPGNALCRGTQDGGTIARLSFTSNAVGGDCKCGGVDFRVHNPPTGVSGPKGIVDIGGCNNAPLPTGTDSMRIQPDTPIDGGPIDDVIDAAADCGTFTRTLTYPPFTVSDPCVEGSAEPLCTVEFRAACTTSLDCGMGNLCNDAADCGGLDCVPHEDAGELGFTGFCALARCLDGVCDNAARPAGIDFNDYLDCADGCDFLPGETKIWCSYTNGCGNTSERHVTVRNSGMNKLIVDVELSPTMFDGTAGDPIRRCIDFSVSACDAATFYACGPSAPSPGKLCFPQDSNACGGFPELCVETPAPAFGVSANVVFGAPDNIPGHGTACIDVPPANYDCLEARDPKHSLSSTCTVECTEAGVLYAQFKGSKATHPTCHWLVQGNLDGDNDIDIFDYTILAGQYLDTYVSNDTLCKDPDDPPIKNNFNADFNGDKVVTLADWSFVVFNFFCASKDPCSAICDPAPETTVPASKVDVPRGAVSVRELRARGLGPYAEAADVNRDGVVDLTDISLFFETVNESDSRIDAYKDHVKKLERSHRVRSILPRGQRTR